MNLEQALKHLAECEPGKFGIEFHSSLGEAFAWTDGKYEAGVAFELLSQDDLDEIAALIGWEYEVARHKDRDVWDWCYYRKGLGKKDWQCSDPFGNDAVPTKLEAAKAALIAIIQSQYPIGR